MNTTPTSENKTLNLALQGGGSHGAYAWGVLDRLLDEEDITIEAISAASAGAMNAAVFVSGMATGGRDGARAALADFWNGVSDLAYSMDTTAMDQFLAPWNLSLAPWHHMMDVWANMVSPYDSNPLNINPLRDVLARVVDIDAIRQCKHIKLFISATHVKSGQVRIFNHEEMSIDVLLASACLPQVFQAVEIDGEHYWDGGYMGNPAIHPLIYQCQSSDVALIQITPIYRDQLPKQPIEITNRVNEINFNSSLIAEMRAIDFVKRLIAKDALSSEQYKDILMHRIYAPEAFAELDASSKMNTNKNFFAMLHSLGRESCGTWLAAHKKDIGVRDSIDIRKTFLSGAHG